MFDIKNKEKIFFDENGYLIKTVLDNNNTFKFLANKFKKEIDNISLTELKTISGYTAGNLNIAPGLLGTEIYDMIKSINFGNFFYNLVGEKIDNYEVKIGGNLNLPNSSFQLFHTDGNWMPKMFILNIATSTIDYNNGPMEVYEKSHKYFLPYWKFILKKFIFKKKIVVLKPGEIIFREHRLWHRGTKNYSKKYRELLGIIFIKSENKLSEKNQLMSKTNNIIIHSNMFEESFKGKFKELIFVYIKPLYKIYKIILSLIKNI